MIHHSSVPYAVASSDAARQGRAKMEEIISNGLASVEATLNQVQSQIPNDRIAKGSALKFLPDPAGFRLIAGDGASLGVHKNAFSQILGKAGMPTDYAGLLVEKGTWGQELLSDNLSRIYAHDDARHLLRDVGGEVRGFLSDRYRRLDSRPLLDAFIGACQRIGAVPVQGVALDTKVRVRAVLPEVFEPIPNEILMFGVEWGNSDFGNGGHAVRVFCVRTICTNLATGEEALRQVHIGKRLEDNIEYSRKTLELDTRANVSALGDVIDSTLAPTRVNAYMSVIREANNQSLEGKDVASILKKSLTKGEVEQATTLFNSPDVVNLPPGNTVWRMSNVCSWLAQAKNVSADRQLELQKVAGSLLPSIKAKAVEV